MGQTVTAGQYLTFSLKSQVYGVPIGAVREINRVSDITPVPQTPEFVVGVMNLRGKVIPVVDLRKRFQIESIDHTRETCIIVIEASHGQIGMIVDSVREVVSLAEGQIELSPAMGEKEKMAFILGMGKIQQKVIILVDIVLVLSNIDVRCTLEKEPAAA